MTLKPGHERWEQGILFTTNRRLHVHLTRVYREFGTVSELYHIHETLMHAMWLEGASAY